MPEKHHSPRDAERTREPEDTTGGAPSPRFVIQEHQASSHHFDFRLQVGEVLKSWAVPRGPSTDPRQRRLAVPTEDHSLDHLHFEGATHGAGTVIVWDTGPYRNLTTGEARQEVPVDQAVADGHVAVWLEGKKLAGGYALTRTATGENERWILVKMKDSEADAHRDPVITDRDSVLTGRTLEDVAAEHLDPG